MEVDCSGLATLGRRDLQRIAKDRSLNTEASNDQMIAAITAWEVENKNMFLNISRRFTSTEQTEEEKEKERLEEEEEEKESEDELDKVDHPNLKFRSYKPRNLALQKYVQKRASIVGAEKLKQINDKLKLLESSIDDDTISLVPKKMNWDLKRDLAPRLSKLEKHTTRAVYNEIRKKMKLQEETAATDNKSDTQLSGEDLVTAVNNAEMPQTE
ncbi:coiled-coil domain-containing protein 12 [Pelomyxa schiedti]|nr:coiled-coil domain-containing protein 12 [Pelomyxa schiedti]